MSCARLHLLIMLDTQLKQLVHAIQLWAFVNTYRKRAAMAALMRTVHHLCCCLNCNSWMGINAYINYNETKTKKHQLMKFFDAASFSKPSL